MLALASLTAVGHVHAATPASLSVRMEQPKTPTNQSNLKINVVALDREGNPVTVQCEMWGPTNADWTSMGPAQNLPNGGSSTNCQPSTALSTTGVYQFRAKASAGGTDKYSNIVSVDFSVSGPGTPTNYSKTKISSCTNKIRFKTADDGKTTYVEIYRSDSSSFTAEASTRVGSMGIGPNTEAQFDNDVPDCNKTYYYAVRAFDGYGNASGVVGDSETITVIDGGTTTTETVTGGGESSGAVGAVLAGTTTNRLGDEQLEGDVDGKSERDELMEETGEVLGDEAAEAVEKTMSDGPNVLGVPINRRTVGITGLIIAIIGAWVYRRRPKRS